MTGVYEARKKSGEIYYRASFTYKINTSASEVPLTRLPVMPCTTKPVR